ncbi:MAG: zinc finger domain-containing protein [Acidimicrobiales bacterium]|nr:zinc finger domain-containing protein [Acidimicrobiales bacterium]MDP6901717.1 zinc finger domain-containing protein [Acidimicrobiales bacterium]
MPEGHTIHRLSKDLRSDLSAGVVKATSPQGRFERGASLINRKLLVTSEAWGKHLFLTFSGETILHIHLGLIGKFRPQALEHEPSDTVRLRLEGSRAWHLTGPQKCALVPKEELLRVIDDLGPDPLRRGSKCEDFVSGLTNRKTPIAVALLDQSVIAGVGNVYRAEFLFLLGIHPQRPSYDLTQTELEELWEVSVSQLRQGVRLNRIVTVSQTDSGTSPGRLKPEDALYVYKREGQPCRRCGSLIRVAKLAGRSCWWCDRCQRR